MRNILATEHYQTTSPLPWDTEVLSGPFIRIFQYLIRWATKIQQQKKKKTKKDQARWCPHSQLSVLAHKSCSATFPKFFSPFHWGLKGFEKGGLGREGRSFNCAGRSHIEHEKSWPQRPAIPNLKPKTAWRHRVKIRGSTASREVSALCTAGARACRSTRPEEARSARALSNQRLGSPLLLIKSRNLISKVALHYSFLFPESKNF